MRSVSLPLSFISTRHLVTMSVCALRCSQSSGGSPWGSSAAHEQCHWAFKRWDAETGFARSIATFSSMFTNYGIEGAATFFMSCKYHLTVSFACMRAYNAIILTSVLLRSYHFLRPICSQLPFFITNCWYSFDWVFVVKELSHIFIVSIGLENGWLSTR